MNRGNAATGDSPAAQEQPTVVCVLGMARSGTSLTTRILNLCGVYLGAEDELLPPLPANPEGFWENVGIMKVNEEILESFGGKWSEPPRLPPDWEASEEMDSRRKSAVDLLEESFAGRKLWGWKDPRSCLTLPFWQQILPDLRYVICLRNPVDVAASVERRDRLLVELGQTPHGVVLEQAFDLWLEYLASAIVHTAGRPRVFVSYDEYFNDWRVPAKRLARFVDRDPATFDAESEEAFEKAINGRLRHHRTPLVEVIQDKRISSEAVALHLITEQLLTLTSAGDTGPAADRLEEFQAAADLYAQRLLVRVALDRHG
jgi:hypothetical protein